MKRWLAFIPVAVLVALAALFAFKSLGRDPHVQPQALVGKPLPDLTLPPLEGGAPQALRAVARGPVLVNVYASWCAPCAEEAPALAALKAEGVPIVGLAYKDAPDRNQAFLARYGDPFRARLVDAEGLAGLDLGVTGPPETYAVNAAGVIVAKHVGPMSVEQGRALLARAR